MANAIDTLDDAWSAAIKTAILAGDPTCPPQNVWTYRRIPMPPTPDKVQAIFGAKVSGAIVYHGWDMTKTFSGEDQEEAESGNDTVLSSTEIWKVRGCYSVQDEKASELTFRKIAANVHHQLRQHNAITNLIRTYQIYLDTVSMDSFNIGPMLIDGGELVHEVDFTLTFGYKDHQ